MARTAIHPGEHIQDEMDELKLTAEVFATKLGISAESLKAVLVGRTELTADLALRLGHFFEMRPAFWLGLQNLHDLRVAEQKDGASIDALPTAKELIAA